MIRIFGIVVSFLVGIGALYEGIALVSPLPTLSRMTQGLRDGGQKELVFVISMVVVCILAMFGAWLYYHFNFQVRSGN